MTAPGLADWPDGRSDRFRRAEVSAVIGSGDAVWRRATSDVRRWKVKTRSGFAVDDTRPVAIGARPIITARVLWVTVREPVEVVEVVESATRVGFSYRTLPFIVHRNGDDVVLTIRSLTRPAPEQPWRALFPLLRVAQLVARRRYLRALR